MPGALACSVPGIVAGRILVAAEAAAFFRQAARLGVLRHHVRLAARAMFPEIAAASWGLQHSIPGSAHHCGIVMALDARVFQIWEHCLCPRRAGAGMPQMDG